MIVLYLSPFFQQTRSSTKHVKHRPSATVETATFAIILPCALPMNSESVTQRKQRMLIVTYSSVDYDCAVLLFYRTMHYSAKRGLAIACRLSIHLSVTLVDHGHIG